MLDSWEANGVAHMLTWTVLFVKYEVVHIESALR
jgi:hypothetical protein